MSEELETSRQEGDAREISKIIGQGIIDLYGSFMSPDTKEKGQELPEKVITVTGSQYRKRKKKGGLAAFYSKNEDLIVINEDYIDEIATATGFVGVTRSEILTTLIALEAAHRFQNHKAARMFLECGSSYYARSVLKHLGKRCVYEEINEKRAVFFERLIERAGSSVHRLFFGTSSEEEKYQVYGFMDEHREELTQLFPEAGKR